MNDFDYYVIMIYGRTINQIWDKTKEYPDCKCGLFNQLFQLINRMANPEFDLKNHDTWIDIFSIDHILGKTIPISEILNLEEMNKFGYRFYDGMNWNNKKFTKVLYFDGIFHIYWSNPKSFEDSCKKIIFSDKILKVGKDLINLNNLQEKEVNLVHIRTADPVFKQHCVMLNKEDSYNKTNQMILDSIYDNCDKKTPLVILANDKNHEIIQKLANDFELIWVTKEEYAGYLDPNLHGRDIFALCDVSFVMNLNINNFIYHESLDSSNPDVSSYSLFLKNTLSYKRGINYWAK
jgi:hypothetical protein